MTGYYCLGVCYASNNPTRFFTGHFWTDVLRQKVSSLSTSMKTAWLCACEITLLKCLFSAVYSFNTLSFILVIICRVFIIPPNSVLCFNVYSMCTVCCMVTYLCWLSQIYLNLILTSEVNKHIVIYVLWFFLSFNVPLLLLCIPNSMTASTYLSVVHEQNNSKL